MLSIQYKSDNRARGTVRCPFSYDFTHFCSKYLQIKLFVDGLPNCKDCKSFVPQKFKRIWYVLYGCTTVALLCNQAAGCVTGRPVMQPARTKRNFMHQVIWQPCHFIRQLWADLTTYHLAAEFQKYIESVFPVDGKQNRSAINHCARAFLQCARAHLKGAASADENKAFCYLIYCVMHLQSLSGCQFV